jgi:putative CocE/NonD family hydrolase
MRSSCRFTSHLAFPAGTKRWLLALLALVALLLRPCWAGAQSFRDLYTKIEYMIPARDGVKLYTSVYVPKNKPGKHPILLERTPYGAGPYGPYLYRGGVRGSQKMVENGYIFAFQDVRGLGRSEGVFVNDRPELIVSRKPDDIDESTDTYDAIDYLVKNVPDNNGRVGLWGISYPGFYAGVGAINSHPALKAASPQAPVSDWFVGDDFHHNGALFLMDAVSFARFGESKEVSEHSSMPPVNSGGDPYGFYLREGALGDLTDKYFKETDGLWKYVMEHGTYDEYWQARSLPPHMQNVHCAVMVVGGWFDAEDCWGAINTYKATTMQNRNIPTLFVEGPWYHGMWAGGGGSTFGDMDWGQPTSQYYRDEIEFPFFDAYLRGDGRTRLTGARVFETGANRWRTFSQWPPRGLKETSITLAAGKRLIIGTSAGVAGAAYDEYVSDPANPVPYQGGEIHGRTREYMLDDQRFAEKRPDVETYATEPLAQDITLAGPINADLFISTTGSDADFIVKVIDVFPDNAPGKLAGYEMLVRAEVMRSRFRNSYSNPAPLTPDKVERVSYALPDVFHTFKRGHRLMVQIQSSWFPLVDLNPQQYIDVNRARQGDFKKATIRIYHDGEHSSRLKAGVLPP